MSNQADGFSPTKSFFYALTDFLANFIALMTTRSRINGGTATALVIAGNMRGYFFRPTGFNKTFGVVVFIRPDCFSVGAGQFFKLLRSSVAFGVTVGQTGVGFYDETVAFSITV